MIFVSLIIYIIYATVIDDQTSICENKIREQNTEEILLYIESKQTTINSLQFKLEQITNNNYENNFTDLLEMKILFEESLKEEIDKSVKYIKMLNKYSYTQNTINHNRQEYDIKDLIRKIKEHKNVLEQMQIKYFAIID